LPKKGTKWNTASIDGYAIDFSAFMEEEIQETQRKTKKWSPGKGEKNK
jgi:hypothetical protein